MRREQLLGADTAEKTKEKENNFAKKLGEAERKGKTGQSLNNIRGE